MTFSWRPSGVISLINTTFQFKLFANNVTKFGAPGNRTPLFLNNSFYRRWKDLKNFLSCDFNSMVTFSND